GDAWAIALAAGSDKAYVHNQLVDMRGAAFLHKKLKYHGLHGGVIERGEYMMVPVSFLATVLEANYVASNKGRVAEIQLKDGRMIQFAQGNIGCVVDNKVHAMLCEAVLKNGQLYIPIQWIFQRL